MNNNNNNNNNNKTFKYTRNGAYCPNNAEIRAADNQSDLGILLWL